MGRLFIFLFFFSNAVSSAMLNKNPIQAIDGGKNNAFGIVYDIFIDGSVIYIGADNGLFLKQGDSLKKVDWLNKVTTAPITSINLVGGALWIGTYGDGVFILDLHSETVLDGIYYGDDLDNFVLRIEKINDEHVLLITEIGIKLVSFDDLNSVGIINEELAIGLVVESEESFIFSTKQGVFRYTLKTQNIEKLFGYVEGSTVNETQINLTDKLLYVITADVIYKYDLKSKSLSTVLNSLDISFGTNDILHINDTELLIAGDSLQYVSDKESSNSLLSPILESNYVNVVYDIERTVSGNILIGGPRFGVAVLPRSYQDLKFLSNKGLLQTGRFQGFWTNGQTSIVGFNSKIYKLNSDTGELIELLSDSKWEMVLSFGNHLIASDITDGAWVLGLDEINTRVNLLNKLDIPGKLVDLEILGDSGFILNENGEIYSLSQDLELNKIPIDFSPDILFSVGDALIAQDYFNGIYYSHNGSNWFQIEHTEFQNNVQLECASKSLSGTILFCSSGNGVLKLESENLTLSRSVINSHLKSQNVRGINIDEIGHTWVSTSDGLYRVDESKGWVQKVGIQYGIVDVDFEYEGIISIDNGKKLLVIGDYLSYTLEPQFFGKSLNRDLQRKSILDIYEIRSFSGTGQDAGYVDYDLRQERSLYTEIKNDVYLTEIHFAARDPIDHDYLYFEYRLLGLSNEWKAATKGNAYVSYSSLPFGEYEFQVRAIDKQSIAEQPIASRKIIVLPPIWFTLEAFFLYFILVILLIFLVKLLTRKSKASHIAFAKSYTEGQTSKLAKKVSALSSALQKEKMMFRSLSREIRNPLTQVSCWLDSANDHRRREDLNESITSSLSTISRVNTLLDQMHELEALVGDKQDSGVTLDVIDSLSALIECYEEFARQKKVRLTLKGKKKIYIRVNKNSFERIFSNLLANAIKYSDSNDEILIRPKIQGEYVDIEVIDKGCGIAKDDVDRIYERFTKLDNNENVEGSGLGLAVVNELVRANDGSIIVESELGVGTKFTVRFEIQQQLNEPVVKIDPKKIVPLDSMCVEENGDGDIINSKHHTLADKEVILVADSSIHIRSSISKMFEPKFRCIRAGNGNEALEIARSIVPDCVILDSDLPLKNAITICKQLRSENNTSHMPIIIISANPDKGLRLEALHAKANDYFIKPFDQMELKLKVERIIEAQIYQVNVEDTKQLETLDLEDIVMPVFEDEKDQRFYMNLVVLLQQHYTDPSFNREFAASALSCTDRQLNRKLNEFLDLSFTGFVKQYRLKKAAKRLLVSDNISDVAYDLGFGSPSYFGMCFKEYFNMTPTQYIQTNRKPKPIEHLSKESMCAGK
ncbi:ATP-binding protein [Alteromonas facilis]|uniref:hybrid sensor histidine kinase/response regulator transcription factor n=1 Tax=Alteromonas facilis TaxID=2048004 RepID=UPI000C284BD5|nr:ATP-binding protein [Alteromonas facilis]